MVHNKVLTLLEYLALMDIQVDSQIFPDKKVSTISALRFYMDWLGIDVWDYPLNEIDHIVDNNADTDTRVALVTDGNEYRWFEISE